MGVAQSSQKQKKLKKQRLAAVVLAQKLYRGILARRWYQRTLHRKRIVKELITTEETYVYYLKTLLEVFITPLRDSLIINKDQIRQIFSVADILYSFHNELLASLVERFNKWWYNQILSDILLQLTMYVRIYSQYANNFNQSLSCLASLEKNQQFVKFIMNAEQRVECHDQPIRSILVMPIQRIPRYLLLFKELIKFTDQTHPDFDGLQSVDSKLQEIATLINDRKRDWERYSNLVRIQRLITPKIMDLISPARRLVWEGDIKMFKLKRQSHGSDDINLKTIFGRALQKDRRLLLFNDQLMICKQQKESYKLSIRAKFYKDDGEIILLIEGISDFFLPSNKMANAVQISGAEISCPILILLGDPVEKEELLKLSPNNKRKTMMKEDSARK